MSSNSSAIGEIMLTQQNDYRSFAIIITVVYDYVLTLSEEVEHIWMQPWTLVTALFIVVRYVGLYNLIVTELIGSSFLPGPSQLCGIMYITRQWSFLLFVGAADCAMILRVWAMYNQSRLVLITLLLFFSVMVILTAVDCIIMTTMTLKNIWMAYVETIQILDTSFCSFQLYSPSVDVWAQGLVATIPQMVHGALLCTLVIIHFVKQSIQMYRVSLRWELNKYVNLMVKQGIIYFFVAFSLYIISLLNITTEAESIITSILACVPMVTLTPRFIISIRKLYAHDVRRRRGEGIDSGFGMSTLSGRSTPGTAMVLADVEQNERLEDRRNH